MLGLRWGWLLIVPWAAYTLSTTLPVLDAGTFLVELVVALLLPYTVVRVGAELVGAGSQERTTHTTDGET